MTVPEYTTGDRTAVVRPGFVALVGAEVSDDVVRALWDAADDGVVGALAVLARDGLTGLPSFALVAVSGRRVHVALRGDVEVVLTGDTDQVLHAGEVSTWSERTVDGVTEVSVRVPAAEADGSALPVADGVVRAAEVWVPLTALEESTGAAAARVPDASRVVVAQTPVVVEADVADVADVADGVVGDEGASRAVPADEAVPVDDVPDTVVADDAVADDAVADDAADDSADDPADDPVADDTVADDPVVDDRAPDADADPLTADVYFPAAPTADPGRTNASSDDVGSTEPEDDRAQLIGTPEGLVDDGPGAADLAEVVAAAEAFLAGPRHVAPHRLIDLPDVPATPTAQAQAQAPEQALGAASADDHDGLTILSSDLAAIRDGFPSWAADEAPGPFRTPTVVEPARIVLSTGLVVTLDRAVLLGRAPQVARVTNRELPRLVTVPSPQQDISRTHAEVRVEGEHVLVTDLDSTNGVHVSRPGEGARRLHPGEASVVGAGEVVDLGDGVTFTVERGS